MVAWLTNLCLIPLQDGEPVDYVTSQGERLLSGVVQIGDASGVGSGILCACCGEVISCSLFEAHAGRGSRRAPYDNIYTQVQLYGLADNQAQDSGPATGHAHEMYLHICAAAELALSLHLYIWCISRAALMY